MTAASLQSINPVTGDIIDTFEVYSVSQVDEALGQARAAFTDWRFTTFIERAAALHAVARTLRQRKADLARIATLEMPSRRQ